MQPDAAGLALATGVLAAVIAAFGLASRLISGAVAGLSYAIGLAVARGLAEWTAPEGERSPAAAGDLDGRRPGSSEDGESVDGDPPAGPELTLTPVAGSRPRLRIECRPAGST